LTYAYRASTLSGRRLPKAYQSCFGSRVNMNPKPAPMFWKKEFAWSYSTVERLAIAKSKRLGNIFREYARYCTVHGVQYIFKDNSSLIERFDILNSFNSKKHKYLHNSNHTSTTTCILFQVHLVSDRVNQFCLR